MNRAEKLVKEKGTVEAMMDVLSDGKEYSGNCKYCAYSEPWRACFMEGTGCKDGIREHFEEEVDD